LKKPAQRAGFFLPEFQAMALSSLTKKMPESKSGALLNTRVILQEVNVFCGTLFTMCFTILRKSLGTVGNCEDLPNKIVTICFY